jgi:hypothetical protein
MAQQFHNSGIGLQSLSSTEGMPSLGTAIPQAKTDVKFCYLMPNFATKF